MTGHIVDRQDLDRKIAEAQVVLQGWAEQAGYRGVLGRMGLASIALDEWLADEINRGTPYHEIVQATIERSGAAVAARLESLDAAGREACLQVLDSFIRRGLTHFDRRTPEQVSASSMTTHPRQ